MNFVAVFWHLFAHGANIVALAAGAGLGMVFGVLPGLGSAQVLALLLPITYGLDSNTAVILMLSAAVGTVFAGSVTSILIGVPGTPINIATIIDGYPLAKQGKAGIAIGAAGASSAIGGIIGIIILIAILPLSKVLIMSMSYPELFMMIALGIACITSISEGSRTRNLISGILGLTLATFGFEPMGSALRFTFGIPYLWDGIKIIPTVIGLFGITEGLNLIIHDAPISSPPKGSSLSQILRGACEPFKHWGTTLRSAIVGTGIGIIPGIGASLSQFVAYTMTVQVSKDKSRFGQGDIRGVISAETTNNATQGGALIPLLLFGIPGDLITALLLGALMLHDIPAGLNIVTRPDLLLSIISTEVIANIFVVCIGFVLAGYLIKLTAIRSDIIGIVVICLSVLGAFVYQQDVRDVILAIILGIVGFFMIRLDFSRISLAIGLILGSMAEMNFKQTLLTGGIGAFFTRPISLVLFVLMIFVLVYGFRAHKKDFHGESSLGE